MTWHWVFVTCVLAAIGWLLVVLLGKKELFRRIPPGARLPPMPPKNSVRGHVEVLRPDFHQKKAFEWSKAYGPVFRLKLNFYNIVILSSFEAVQKFLNTKELLNRSHCFLPARDFYTGVGSLNGISWMANRKFCLNKLRHVGSVKTGIEDNMMEEFRRLSEKLSDTNGEPIHVGQFVMQSIVHNIASLVYGVGPPDDPSRFKLNRIMKQLSDVITTGPMFQFTPPSLRRLEYHLRCTRNSRLNTAMVDLEEFSITQVEVHRAAFPQDGMNDFIQSYVEKIEHEKHHSDASFTHRYLVGTLTGILIGGTFTTTAAVQMHLVNFASSPETIQASVQKEIDEVIGHERCPTWEDRKRMPFTIACMWELERWKPSSVFGAARECSADVVIDDFFIPRGTVVLANIWAVHHDPALWKEPKKFIPSRFLNKDGSILTHKPEFLIPFSTGRRSCPGETFASMQTFLMVTRLLQQFQVLLSDPTDIHLVSDDVLPHKIHQIRLRFVERHHTHT